MVEVAVDRLGIAGGRGAGSCAGTNDVLKPAAGGVLILGVPVVTSALSDGAEGDVQAADQVGQLLGVRRVG